MSAFAEALWRARQGGEPIAAPEGLGLDEAYAVAASHHARRLAGGARAVGRKIGHTFPATWAEQGIAAPTWGWLYEGSTRLLDDPLKLGGWREPKGELEIVLRLGRGARPEAMALGLEVVDRPYLGWDFSVPASVAAGGVHAALLHGPWQPFEAAHHGPLLAQLRARLRVGDALSQGGSERVLGSPLAALDALADLLQAQGAPPLQAGEIVSTGALAPALPLRCGSACGAVVKGLPLAPLGWSCS